MTLLKAAFKFLNIFAEQKPRHLIVILLCFRLQTADFFCKSTFGLVVFFLR